MARAVVLGGAGMRVTSDSKFEIGDLRSGEEGCGGLETMCGIMWFFVLGFLSCFLSFVFPFGAGGGEGFGVYVERGQEKNPDKP